MADLKYPAVLPANKASEQLEIAKSLVAALQATNVALRSETIVLATRLLELSRNVVPKSDLDKLTLENQELRKKLDAAQKGGSTTAGGMSAEQLEQQLKVARARLEAFEAKAVPYTPEELALFKQPDKKIEVTAVKPAKKPNEIPAGAGPLIFEAQRALDNGRLDEAEKKYQEVLHQDEKNTYTLVRLAAVQIEQNHLEDAEKNVNKAISLDPEDALCLYLKGYLCLQQNKPDAALDALSLSAKLLPDEARTQYLLGKVLLQKGAPAQAETALRKAIQLMPGYREAHYSLALIYSKQKPPLRELAQWHYRKATQLGYPADPDFEKQLQEAPTVSASQ
jgi:tetratricopeptide (TPR) repeat protein